MKCDYEFDEYVDRCVNLSPTFSRFISNDTDVFDGSVKFMLQFIYILPPTEATCLDFIFYTHQWKQQTF